MKKIYISPSLLNCTRSLILALNNDSKAKHKTHHYIDKILNAEVSIYYDYTINDNDVYFFIKDFIEEFEFDISKIKLMATICYNIYFHLLNDIDSNAVDLINILIGDLNKDKPSVMLCRVGGISLNLDGDYVTSTGFTIIRMLNDDIWEASGKQIKSTYDNCIDLFRRPL